MMIMQKNKGSRRSNLEKMKCRARAEGTPNNVVFSAIHLHGDRFPGDTMTGDAHTEALGEQWVTWRGIIDGSQTPILEPKVLNVQINL